MAVGKNGVCFISYQYPTEVGEVVEEQVELLPFADIQDIFEEVSLLSIQNFEMYEDLTDMTLDVREIRFGYRLVKQPESIGGYRYIPVWDFYGIDWPIYGEGSYYPENRDEPVFTINAINGTVIDRWMGY